MKERGEVKLFAQSGERGFPGFWNQAEEDS
jgi:hypothetical protein